MPFRRLHNRIQFQVRIRTAASDSCRNHPAEMLIAETTASMAPAAARQCPQAPLIDDSNGIFPINRVSNGPGFGNVVVKACRCRAD